MASTYLMLSGEDTRYKHKYVTWEAEVAIEKGCTIIGVNLNMSWRFDAIRTPGVLKDIGAAFVAFSPQIVAYALKNYRMHDAGNRFYPEETYCKLGYTITGAKSPSVARLAKAVDVTGQAIEPKAAQGSSLPSRHDLLGFSERPPGREMVIDGDKAAPARAVGKGNQGLP